MAENDTYDTGSKPRCPFYGFYYYPGALTDNRGNQCALKPSYPCRMEMRRLEIDWDQCDLEAEEERIREQLQVSQIFPDHLRPKGQTSWGGILFREWYEAIMGRPYTLLN